MRDEKGLFELTMLVEVNGALSPAREYAHQGKVYVEGIDGSRYALRVRNLTGARLEVVPSVDGLAVQSGEEASFSRRGLVINAHGSYDFEGYRLDMTAVATFRFGGVAGSYAAQMGKPRNIGVIGVAVFEEKPPPPPAAAPPEERYAPSDVARSTAPMMRSAAPAPSRSAPPGGAPPPQAPQAPPGAPPRPGAGAAPVPQSLGTSFGERREAKINSTSFDRATSSPASVSSLRYEHRESLRALGISIDDLAARETANPFPAEPGPFAKPPPGWKG
ncbi:MAG: hypothetical protein ABI134_35350 [Byssovorax sp.]